MKTTEHELRPMIAELFGAFPILSSWFTGLGEDNQTGVRRAWHRSLMEFEAADIGWAVCQFVDGHAPMPPNYEFDRLGYVLKQWANIAAGKRLESENREKLKNQASPVRAAGSVLHRFGTAMRTSQMLGCACKHRAITKEENAEMLAVANRFHIDGDCSLPVLSETVLAKVSAAGDGETVKRYREAIAKCNNT